MHICLPCPKCNSDAQLWAVLLKAVTFAKQDTNDISVNSSHKTFSWTCFHDIQKVKHQSASSCWIQLFLCNCLYTSSYKKHLLCRDFSVCKGICQKLGELCLVFVILKELLPFVWQCGVLLNFSSDLLPTSFSYGLLQAVCNISIPLHVNPFYLSQLVR